MKISEKWTKTAKIPVVISLFVLVYLVLSRKPHFHTLVICRWVIAITCLFLTFEFYKQGKTPVAALFLLIACVYQPITNFSLAENVWLVINIVLGFILIVYLYSTFIDFKAFVTHLKAVRKYIDAVTEKNEGLAYFYYLFVMLFVLFILALLGHLIELVFKVSLL